MILKISRKKRVLSLLLQLEEKKEVKRDLDQGISIPKTKNIRKKVAIKAASIRKTEIRIKKKKKIKKGKNTRIKIKKKIKIKIKKRIRIKKVKSLKNVNSNHKYNTKS